MFEERTSSNNMYRVSALFLLMLSLAVTKVDLQEVVQEQYGIPQDTILRNYPPNNSEEEYIRHIHSMMNAYRSDMLGGLVIETNSMVDTKYKAWKRNADLINSLLALPKGMNDAGR